MRRIKTFESFNQLNEKSPCWKGYKQVGTKMKNGKEVPNCVPINENEETTITCENCKWEWQLEDGGKDPYVCHKCGHDNTSKS